MSKDKAVVPGSHEELKEKAFEIFVSEVKGKRQGFQAGKLALESFRLAKEFMDVDFQIEAGELSAERPAPEATVWVDVNLQEQNGERWVPTKDPRTGKQITAKMLQDPDSFAPNLPLDHPINQRTSQHGKEAWAEAQAEREARMLAAESAAA